MSTNLIEIIKRNSKEIQPIATGEDPILERLSGIRAVAFDIYGTLLISGSGDVGAHDESSHLTAMREALAACGLVSVNEENAEKILRSCISAEQKRMKDEGVSYPEIEIRDIWKSVLEELKNNGAEIADISDDFIERIAVEHESRANPVWLMPGTEQILKQIKLTGLRLAIVSNAQFYTPIVLEALTGRSVPALGFPKLDCVWSFEMRKGKPDTALYEELADRLSDRHGIVPEETLFVGNDLLKDVWAASQCGFKTALFAGDKRSLRRHEEDARTSGLVPDITITDLRQLELVLKLDRLED